MNPAYEHNGQPVSREAFYAIACDPARSVAVEACAGAGKTWMLVSRMLRALLDGSAPHEILAITFTKKAAGEMRQRLQEWLEQFAHATPEHLEKELISRGIGLQAAQDKRDQLQNLYQQLLASGRPLQIRTFHSWFAALLSTAPLALLQERGLPTHYELLEDDAQAKAEVWRPFLQAVAQDEALRADYEAVVAVHGRFQAHKALEAALDKRVEFQLADEAGIVDASVPPFAAVYARLAGVEHPSDWLLQRAAGRAMLEEAARALAPLAKTFAAKGAELAAAVQAGDWNGVLCALFTEDGKGTPRAFGKSRPEAVTAAQNEAQTLRDASRQHAAWQHQQRMARLSRCLIECFGQLKRQRGWVDMNDVERTALTLLSDPVLSGWVQERLDARVRHLLVDEFQDTNPLQWQALHAWLSGYAGAGGGQAAPSVFIVGDPKQSIYRFRRAEPQVFLAAQAFVREALGGDLLACDHTRRNARGVIAVVNAAMQAAQAQQEYSGFREHTTESQDAGELLRLPPITKADAQEGGEEAEGAGPLAWRDSLTEPRHEAEESLRMQESAQAAQWVAAQLAAGLPANEIMVLARQRERLARMEEALRALHIPCVQPEKADLAQAPEVQDLVALLDVLVSPAHDLSLARALKSPLFGCDDALLTELALLRRQEQHARLSWFDLLQNKELLTLDCKAIAANLILYKRWVDELPPHDALQAIYQHGDVLARFAAAAPAPQRAGVLANLRALLGAALQQDGGRYLTPYAFVRALKKGGIPAPARADAQAVRLLTVHGAKGLEAHSVLLLDTDARAKKAETMAVLVDWPGEQQLPRRFIFLASESNPPPSAGDTMAQEQQERQREALNTLYVAVTRAKQRLVLSCVQTGSANPGSWWARLAPLMQQDVKPLADAAPSAAGADAAFTLLELPRLPAGLVMPAAPPKPAEPDSLCARQGQAMHALLEQVGVTGLPLQEARTDGWGADRLGRLAREFALPAAAAQAAAAMAQAILRGEGAWAWDEAQLELAVNEAPLQHQGQSLRLDRLVRLREARDGARWWVLDYKSAAAPQRQPELIAQLQRYRQAVQSQVGGEAVGAAFLSGEGRVVACAHTGRAQKKAPHLRGLD
ncbi:UvrD-helicase domain-containing protein [Alicycliphilus denitrificans]|uniref:UvrD-helicase domain-containing protein n=1 Tax=Alicycliphilus denitrificans TaxID=179636 RepID=UPI00384A9935